MNGRFWWTMMSFTASLRLQSVSSFQASAKFVQSRSQTSLSSGTHDSLHELLRQIHQIAGKEINVNSHKQVSEAIFGRFQSTSRRALQEAINPRDEQPLDSQKRRLAALVLQYRDMVRSQRQHHPSHSFSEPLRPFSTVSVPEEPAIPPEVPVEVPHHHLDPYEQQIRDMFEDAGCRIDVYWKSAVLELSRPSARSIVAQLDPSACPMGFNPLALPYDPLRGSTNNSPATTTAGKKGSFLAYCREQKEKYPREIILVRCGDFYEAFGVDALMLLEHCGLNAMAGKARAGCPKFNVQATLDCLTAKGFRVAVFEEAPDTDSATGSAAKGGSKSRIKSRYLAQIVSSASPTYLYDLVLMESADTLAAALPSRPYVGILSASSGYTLVEVSIEERSAHVVERLTAEAVACRLAAYPPSEPLFYVPPIAEYESSKMAVALPFLPSRKENSKDGSFGRRVRVLSPRLVEQPTPGVSDIERSKRTILEALLRETSIDIFSDGDNVDDSFALVNLGNFSGEGRTQTHPLYVETATQLGLMDDLAIPSLISHILPASAPAATRRFIRRLLLTPPPPSVGEALANITENLRESKKSLPPLPVPPVGKVLSLLRAGQASAQVYGELLQALDSTRSVVHGYTGDNVVQALMIVLEYESGIAAEPRSLVLRCTKAIDAIESVVSTHHHVAHISNDTVDLISDLGDLVPRAFFERNEASWRGRVRPDVLAAAYRAVATAASALSSAVAQDFWCLSNTSAPRMVRSPVVQDIFNNLVALREVPEHAKARDEYIHPRDRNGKVLRNRYTTDRVQSALSEYVSACEHAAEQVSECLVGLSRQLYRDGHIPAIVQASHANLILSSCYHHGLQANRLGWNSMDVVEKTDDRACALKGVFPYWMPRGEAVANNVDLRGMWVLTSPNMSGKSTLMRSTAAASLLAVCGLCAPVEAGSSIRRFDQLFVRGASSDVPTEQKSAFGAEMGDVAALLRACGSESLVFIDELGRGTSPRDGCSLAAAVLEAMLTSGMSGIFATHLHDILDLPLKGQDRLAKKRMHIDNESDWTYRVEDGVCTNSMALVTAARFGLPDTVLKRAEEFGVQLDAENPGSAYTAVSEPHETLRPKVNALVVKTMESVSGTTCVHIPPRWNVPGAVQGCSCVYVLELRNGVYAGETDDLNVRLERHRTKWPDAVAWAVPLENKTRARAVESQVLRALVQAGASVVSHHDGRTLRRST